MIREILKVYELLKNRTKLVRKRSFHRFRIFFEYHLKREEKDPIFILTTRRTGSNLLLSYLNSVPGVSLAPEVLNKSMFYGIRGRFISKKAVLRHLAYSVNACPQKICGAKLIRTHLERHGITMGDLKKYFPKARFIILYRRSILEQFVSLKIAETTGIWQWTDQFRLPSAIVVKVPELLEFCKRVKNFYQDIFKQDEFTECSLVVNYEELVERPQAIFEKNLFPFLGLPPSPVVTSTKRQNIKRLHEIVQNYTEIIPWIGHPLTCQDYSFESEEWDTFVYDAKEMNG